MQRKYAYIWDVHVHSRLATASSGMSWQVFCESAGIICRPRWENHIFDMTGGIFNDLQWEGPSGPHRNVSEPHAPPGLSPQVTGGGQTGFL